MSNAYSKWYILRLFCSVCSKQVYLSFIITNKCSAIHYHEFEYYELFLMNYIV